MARVLCIVENICEIPESVKKWSDTEWVVWNDNLSEGRVCTLLDDDFWKLRQDFLCKEYRLSDTEWKHFSLEPFQKIEGGSYDEIVFAVGVSMQSQINMIALMSNLYHKNKEQKISWANTQNLPLDKAFQNRITLTTDDVETADYVWQLYCSESPLKMEVYAHNKEERLTALPKAIHTHLMRFPSVKNGLNEIENKLLDAALLFDGSREDFIEYAVSVLKEEGYNTRQIERTMRHLAVLFSDSNPLKVNKKGREAIKGEWNMYSQLRDENEYYGGAVKYDFLYYAVTDKILKL